jgi:hypothetical protein
VREWWMSMLHWVGGHRRASETPPPLGELNLPPDPVRKEQLATAHQDIRAREPVLRALERQAGVVRLEAQKKLRLAGGLNGNDAEPKPKS